MKTIFRPNRPDLSRQKLLSALAILFVLVGSIWATKAMIFFPGEIEFESSAQMLVPGYHEFTLTFAPQQKRWNNMEFRFETSGGLELLGPAVITQQVDTGEVYKWTIPIQVPDRDTSILVFSIFSDGRQYGETERWFVREGDSIRCWPGDPKYAPRPYEPPKYLTPRKPRHEMTKAEPDKEYDIFLYVRKDGDVAKVEGLLGPLPDSAKHPSIWKCYRLRLPLRTIHELDDLGISMDHAHPHDEDLNRRLKIKMSKPQGWRAPSTPDRAGSPASAGISLAHVDGELSYGILPTGQPITFYLWVNNSYGVDIDGLANGFRILSPATA